MIKYAGIGSRELPANYKSLIHRFAEWAASDNWILRSGGAEGSDEAFEYGCDRANGKKEIYLPWKGFNDNDSELYHICDKALKMAEEYHPAWERCRQGGQKLHARNCYQVLGQNLNDPVDCVICYTEGGELKGGTAQAMRIALKHKIPIFNIGQWKDMEECRFMLWSFVNEIIG